VRQVVQVYLDVYASDWGSWIDTPVNSIVVQLLLVGEEQGQICEQNWNDLVDQVKTRVRQRFIKNDLSVREIYFPKSPNYN